MHTPPHKTDYEISLKQQPTTFKDRLYYPSSSTCTSHRGLHTHTTNCLFLEKIARKKEQITEEVQQG